MTPLDPDDRPSPSELVEMPPDRVTLAWCGACAILMTPRPAWTCPECRGDMGAITYEWADDGAER